ncbi:hypothetical protein MKleb_5563 (plasmid) [Klebsiella sp. PL-2018]|nr:hypothetical protein MKleb_5563 [Klebsiella sp. PL-2018]
MANVTGLKHLQTTQFAKVTIPSFLLGPFFSCHPAISFFVQNC